MRRWLQNNWFKIFLTLVLFIIAIEVFFTLYPYVIDGYQTYKSYPPSELFFSKQTSGIKAVDPFNKQP